MKRILCFLLSASLMIALSGCIAYAQPRYEDPVRFFYRSADVAYQDPAGVIQAETRDAAQNRRNSEQLLRMYLEGPESQELRSPFPAGTKLVQFDLNGESAQIMLSFSGTEPKGIDLSIAFACLTKTCLEIAPVKSVTITLENSTVSVTMDADSIILHDSSAD